MSVLQFAEGLSDRQAAGQVRARMDWKFLLGLELDDPGFDFTVLGDFRSRLIRHGGPHAEPDGFVGETLRAALEALAAAAPGWLAPLIDAGWADRYGARIDSYRFPKGEDARERWAGQAGRDGFTLLGAVSAPLAPEWLREVPAVGALRRAWDQQYHQDGEEVRWREGKDLAPGGQRLASPYDLDARYGVKRGPAGRATRLI